MNWTTFIPEREMYDNAASEAAIAISRHLPTGEYWDENAFSFRFANNDLGYEGGVAEITTNATTSDGRQLVHIEFNYFFQKGVGLYVSNNPLPAIIDHCYNLQKYCFCTKEVIQQY